MNVSNLQRVLFLSLIAFIISLTTCSGQTKYQGSIYDVSSDDYFPFKYTREYQEEDNIYTTVYKIYNNKRGGHQYTITATHYKLNKEIKVDIKKIGGGVFFSKIREEKTTYNKPSMKPFGFRGNIGVLRGKSTPNQLMIKFVSNKFENVKVVQVLGTPKVTPNDFFFYILDEKN